MHFSKFRGGALCKSWQCCLDVGSAQHLLILLFLLKQQNHQLVVQRGFLKPVCCYFTDGERLYK